jgi:hypothetical protein
MQRFARAIEVALVICERRCQPDKKPKEFYVFLASEASRDFVRLG